MSCHNSSDSMHRPHENGNYHNTNCAGNTKTTISQYTISQCLQCTYTGEKHKT